MSAAFQMTTHTARAISWGGMAAVVTALVTASAFATPVSREQYITDLRLGQRVLVDDGTCPAGQIKEVLGAKLGAAGVIATRKCVSRKKN